MAKIPPPTQTTVNKIYQVIEDGNQEKHRKHLGASQIGRECERQIWYAFRWAKKESFDGRMLRLFETGRQAEARLADDLRATGATIYNEDPDTGKQFQYTDHGGHFAGSMDGVGVGFVEAPKTWHLIEYKTHNQKSYDDLIKNGVEKSKPEHYAQMQVYMGWAELTRALYVALNKNTDEIYIERVKFDKAEFARNRQKAAEIIFATEPPDRLSNSPAFYKCKWCAFNAICHESGEVAEVNCRTCEHSEARENGTWWCDLHKMELGEGAYVGCADHKHREGMAPASVRAVVREFGGKVETEQKKGGK